MFLWIPCCPLLRAQNQGRHHADHLKHVNGRVNGDGLHRFQASEHAVKMPVRITSSV